MKPTILTCAVVGSTPKRENNPAIPYTPEEIAGSTIEAAKAGAAVAHIHVRDPKTGNYSMELEHYRETVNRIRASGVDIILNLTTGPGARFFPSDEDSRVAGPRTNLSTPERRCEHVVELKPEMCTLDLNTNLGGGGFVTMNMPKEVARIVSMVSAHNVKCEIEVFDHGDIVLAQDLIKEGVLKGPQMFQFVLGTKYGAPALTSCVQTMKSMIPADSEWAAFSISKEAFPMMAQSVILGGHARTGFEDNIYLERGKLAPSNGVLVERAVRMIKDLGRTVATPDEARAILGLRKTA